MSRPSPRSTRRISLSAREGSGIVQSVHVMTTVSTEPSGSGTASAEAARNSIGTRARCARGAAMRRNSADGSSA
jgi:hypothetical protein